MISIIVTTYNNDNKFLKTALPSCITQDIEKEIILIDDASTIPLNEYTKEIIFQNKIKYIKQTKNTGLSGARNTGISMCKYDFYITLDADDFFFPNSIVKIFNYIDNQSSIFHGNLYDNWQNNISYPPCKGRQPIKQDFLNENPLFCSSVVRKKVWERVGGYLVRQGAHYEDWNFWCRAWKAGFKFKYVPVCVYQHTNRGDSMLRELEKNRPYYIKIATQDLL